MKRLNAVSVAVSILSIVQLPGQTLASSVQRLTVAIHSCSSDFAQRPDGTQFIVHPNGLGLIVAERPPDPSAASSGTVFILTAAHVVGAVGGQVQIRLFDDGKWGRGNPGEAISAPALSCTVVSEKIEPIEPPRTADFALVSCDMQDLFKRSFSFRVLAPRGELRRGVPLLLSSNKSEPQGCAPPPADALLFPSYFTFNAFQRPDEIAFFNPLGLDVEGASGGPLITDRSEIVGMVYEARGAARSDVRAFTSGTLRDWLSDLPKTDPKAKFDPKWISLKPLTPSAADLRRFNLEVSGGATVVYVPGFRWLGAAPQYRVSTAIPGLPRFRLTFDYVSSQATSKDGAETLKLSIPSVTGEFHVGSIPFLSSHDPLAGLYLAGGVASTSLTRTLNGLAPTNLEAVTGIFDVGWRYRFPGRPFGIHAAYREAVLHEGSQYAGGQAIYPRFRSTTLGMFLVFK